MFIKLLYPIIILLPLSFATCTPQSPSAPPSLWRMENIIAYELTNGEMKISYYDTFSYTNSYMYGERERKSSTGRIIEEETFQYDRFNNIVFRDAHYQFSGHHILKRKYDTRNRLIFYLNKNVDQLQDHITCIEYKYEKSPHWVEMIQYLDEKMDSVTMWQQKFYNDRDTLDSAITWLSSYFYAIEINPKRVESYFYDSLGRLTHVKNEFRNTYYTYDNIARTGKMEQSNKSDTLLLQEAFYKFDHNWRTIFDSTETYSGSEPSSRVEKTEYLSNSSTKLSYFQHDSLATRWEYDRSERVVKVTHYQNDIETIRYEYDYDIYGNKTKESKYRDGVLSNVIEFFWIEVST